jgi:AraC family transcriptional regulator of arabinose operon
VIHTLAGHARFGLPDRERIVGAGETILYRPGSPQDYDAPQPWHVVWAFFQPRHPWHQWIRWPELSPGTLWMRPPADPFRERIEALLIQAHQLASSALPHAKALGLNALEAAFLWWDVQNPERKPLDPRILDVVEYVARNLDRQLSLAELARQAHLSPSRFSHLFREQIGMAPRSFVEQERLERARELLEMTTLPIHAIAAQVGFHTQFYFADRFHRRLGTSPRAYRATSRARGSRDSFVKSPPL